jgi:hypothetical protein
VTKLSDVDAILVSRPEAAGLLSLSVTEIDRLRRAGHIIAKRHGRKVLDPGGRTAPVTSVGRHPGSDIFSMTSL